MKIEKNLIALNKKQQLVETLFDSLPDVYKRDAVNLNKFYDILASVVAKAVVEKDALLNDNFLSIQTTNEKIVRSTNSFDRLYNESVYKIIQIRNNNDFRKEIVWLSKGMDYAYLTYIPQNYTAVGIYKRNDNYKVQVVSIRGYDSKQNILYFDPIEEDNYYVFEYMDTGDIFTFREIVNVQDNQQGLLFCQLSKKNLVPNSEKVYSTHSNNRYIYQKGIDYSIDYENGIVLIINIDIKEIDIEYLYREDLLSACQLASQTEVIGEIASIIDESTIRVANAPIQDVIRVYNEKTHELYDIANFNYDTISLLGTPLRFKTIELEQAEFVDVQQQDDRFLYTYKLKQENLSYVYRYPIATVTEILGKSRQIINQAKIQIEEEFNRVGSKKIYLSISPLDTSSIEIYKKGGNVKVEYIYNSDSRELSFNITEAGIYVISYFGVTNITFGVSDKIYMRKNISSIYLQYDPINYTSIKIYKEGDSNKIQQVDILSYDVGKQILTFTPIKKEGYYIVEYQSAHWKLDILSDFDSVELYYVDKNIDCKMKLDYYTTKVDLNNRILSIIFNQDAIYEFDNMIIKAEFTNRYYNKSFFYDEKNDKNVITFYKTKQSNEDIYVSYTYNVDIICVDYDYGDNIIDWSSSIKKQQKKEYFYLEKGVKRVKLSGIVDTQQPIYIYVDGDEFKNQVVEIVEYNKQTGFLFFEEIPYSSNYVIEYTNIQQIFNEGDVYYVTYEYGARRYALQNTFAYLLKVPLFNILRQQEVYLNSNSFYVDLQFEQININDIKIYYCLDTEKNNIAKDFRYDEKQMRLYFTFNDSSSVQFGKYIVEYRSNTWHREIFRYAAKGLIPAFLKGPTVEGISEVIKVLTGLEPNIKELKDEKYQLASRDVNSSIEVDVSFKSNILNSNNIQFEGIKFVGFEESKTI